jgi:hypothetical protein
MCVLAMPWFMAKIPDAERAELWRVMGTALRLAMYDCRLNLSQTAEAMDMDVSQLRRQCDGLEKVDAARIYRAYAPELGLESGDLFGAWASHLLDRKSAAWRIVLSHGVAGFIGAFLGGPGEARMARATLPGREDAAACVNDGSGFGSLRAAR